MAFSVDIYIWPGMGKKKSCIVYNTGALNSKVFMFI